MANYVAIDIIDCRGVGVGTADAVNPIGWETDISDAVVRTELSDFFSRLRVGGVVRYDMGIRVADELTEEALLKADKFDIVKRHRDEVNLGVRYWLKRQMDYICRLAFERKPFERTHTSTEKHSFGGHQIVN